ncbi:hypothetical protein TNCV_2612501 [Trichonephila clavipes]|nr:hypothetical protein TNCV_2612501 [Trichonephila clavipes]
MIARAIGLFGQISQFGWTILWLEILRRRNRWPYKQLLNFERLRMAGLIEAGWSMSRIGRHLGQRDVVVARYCH